MDAWLAMIATLANNVDLNLTTTQPLNFALNIVGMGRNSFWNVMMATI